MRYLIITLIIYFQITFIKSDCLAQQGVWTWIHGSNSANDIGFYGIQGISSPANKPPAIYAGSSWKDLNGNFWLFAGWSSVGSIADLWKYDPILNEWTWMKGPGTSNFPGAFGIQGIPSINNNPSSSIRGATTWTDNQGNLWLFGGDYQGPRNDLWKYDVTLNQWSWMKGPMAGNQPGIYGSLGIPDSLNNPPPREEGQAAWVDQNNNLWLFGGVNYSGALNDLWRYNISTNEWTWMKGDSIPNQMGYYGIKEVESPNNLPPDRASYSSWVDIQGNFWLFGGNRSVGIFNDLWKYNPSTNNWTWMDGDSTTFSVGNYINKCDYEVLNMPAARYENRASWTDTYGNFWIFGGSSASFSQDSVRNDLWMYSLVRKKWLWVSGDAGVNTWGNPGLIGVPSILNKPGARAGSLAWSDNSGNLYMFGGSRLSSPGYDFYNDLWKFSIDTLCIGVGFNDSFSNISQMDIFPNPFSDFINIKIQNQSHSHLNLKLTDSFGRIIYQQRVTKLNESNFETRVNLSHLSNGIYFCSIITKDETVSKLIIKK